MIFLWWNVYWIGTILQVWISGTWIGFLKYGKLPLNSHKRFYEDILQRFFLFCLFKQNFYLQGPFALGDNNTDFSCCQHNVVITNDLHGFQCNCSHIYVWRQKKKYIVVKYEWTLISRKCLFWPIKSLHAKSWPWCSDHLPLHMNFTIDWLCCVPYLSVHFTFGIWISFQVLYVSVAIDNIVDALRTQTLRFPKLYTSVFSFKFKRN